METKIYLILEEYQLKIYQAFNTESGEIEPLKFESYEEAQDFASGHCNMWQIIEVNFHSNWKRHQPNWNNFNLKNIHPILNVVS